MPEGVIVTVEDGFATIDFVDPALKGPALNRLIALSGPEVIETLTRQGPRRVYRVPEGNARAAGLVDGASVAPPAPAATSVTYDDGKPDADWHRSALDDYARTVGLDPSKYRNKHDVLEAIRQVEA